MSLRIKTLLQGLLSELSLLPFLQFLQVKFLGKLPLFIVIFVCLKLNDDVEDLSSLGLELIRVHGLKLQGLQSDAEGNLLLLLKLLLGLCHFPAGITTSTTSNRLLFISTSSCFLGLKHFFSLCFCFLKLFLLFFCFFGFLFIQLLQLLLLLLPGLSPFCNVFFQLAVKSLLLLCFFSSVSHCDLLSGLVVTKMPLLLLRMTLLLLF